MSQHLGSTHKIVIQAAATFTKERDEMSPDKITAIQGCQAYELSFWCLIAKSDQSFNSLLVGHEADQNEIKPETNSGFLSAGLPSAESGA